MYIRTSAVLAIKCLLKIKQQPERQGFEPWDPEGSTVFETAPFDRSGTSPRMNI